MSRRTKAFKLLQHSRGLTTGTAAMPRDAANAATTTTGPFLLLGHNGYQAAGQDPARGYIYWPQLDTRRQITSWTRREVARKIQFLYAHFGFVRRLVNGMARMLGYLTPQPVTSDEEWNELAFETFMDIAGSASAWDMSGKFDFFTGQIKDNETIARDGDLLCVKTLGPGGRARMAYYEAHQLANYLTAGRDWVDGVKVINGRHASYSIRDSDNPTVLSEIEAWKCIYMANFENRGQIRPLSILAAAVLNMQDVIETRGFNKQAIKSQARFGHVVETDVQAQATPPIPGSPGTAVNIPVKITQPDGTTSVVNYEAVYAGGQVPALAPGQKMKIIADERPSMNNQAFEEALLRDCCYAADLSYDRLCNLAALTGPGLRMLNADDKRWVKLRHHEQSKRVHQQVIYTLAREMADGRLRQPKLRPGEKWQNQFQYIGLASPDIDGGRTASATLSDLTSGQTHWLETWGQKGVFWKKAIRQRIAEHVFVSAECLKQDAAAGLPQGTSTPERIFPGLYTQKQIAGDPATTPASTVKVDPTQIDGDEPDPDNDPEGTD